MLLKFREASGVLRKTTVKRFPITTRGGNFVEASFQGKKKTFRLTDIHFSNLFDPQLLSTSAQQGLSSAVDAPDCIRILSAARRNYDCDVRPLQSTSLYRETVRLSVAAKVWMTTVAVIFCSYVVLGRTFVHNTYLKTFYSRER